MTEALSITIPTKKYVKHYIDIVCGNPGDLRKIDPSVHQLFCMLLVKDSFENDHKIISDYDTTVDLMVTSRNLVRFGKGISKTNISTINSMLEFQVKQTARQYVKIYQRINVQKKQAIIRFQNDYKFTEDIFSYEAIIKDIQRNS